MGEKPGIKFDWAIVDDLLTAGCTGTEVAAYFGCSPDTLYRAVEKTKGCGFAVYLQEKRSHGDAMIKAQQYAKSVGLSKKGDNMMLIWLGKNRLNQKDNPDQGQIDPKTLEQFKSIMEMLNHAQSASNNALSNINNAEKS